MPESVEPLDRATFDAAELMAAHPPRLRHPNKQAVFEIACPPGSRPSGTVTWSRWPAAPLPSNVDASAAVRALEIREDHYDYVPVLDPADGLDWHVNFADPTLFVAYGGPLFAQDEVQVAQHPVLASLVEALRADGRPDRTVDGHARLGSPTPVLVLGAERRCHVATGPNAAEGRPTGLYGNAFDRAPIDVVRRATLRLDPPTRTNLVAIAAPTPGFGRYSRDEIEYVLRTAYTGFRAAVVETRRTRGDGARTVVHSGYWGCGAFGGNRTLMALLQVVAAGMAVLDALVFHAGVGGSGPVRDAARRLEAIGPTGTADLVERLVADGFEWGVSDGN
jgi:hypothetical protein